MAASASALLRQAKTDEQLAQEVLAGGLDPKLHHTDRGPDAALAEDDESDEVFVQIKMLLTSALNSGQLRSLARAIVLAWQAGYDSKLLRQAEPKMVKKAKEIKLLTDFNNAISQRNRVLLHDCLTTANELGLSEASFPVLADALRVDRELEEEARNIQDAARPEHTKRLGNVIGELSQNLFGVDIDKLQGAVEMEAQAAKEAIDSNCETLRTSLDLLKETCAMSTSSQKLKNLQELQETFQKINPRQLEDLVSNLKEQVEDLRADNAELLIALRETGSKVVTIGAGAASADTAAAAAQEQVEELLSKVAELEQNEEVLRGRIDEAANLGAKWMKEKKDKELDDLRAEFESEKATLRKQVRDEVEMEFKRRSMDVVKQEKKAKVAALQGLEQALTKTWQAKLAQTDAAHRAEVTALKEELDANDKRVKQLEKLIKLRG